jgi:hypothetical protein
MIGAMSVLSVGFGAALARLPERFPARTELFETIAGVFLIGGFAAIGSALPFI